MFLKTIYNFVLSISVLLLVGCAAKVETVYVYKYKTLHCEDAVKPELQELDTKQYISSKANTAKLLSNFASLNLYVERLQQQIECYKSQSLEEDGNSNDNQEQSTKESEIISTNKED